ncbi:hypothetical protein HYY75_00320 [bacterium]|nr:hypothetical protein [bacterium]
MNNQNNEYFVCPNCGKAVQPGLEKCENCAIDVASLKKKKPEVTESANQDSPEENAIPTGSHFKN